MPSKIFLLSPASLNGLRAQQIMSPRAQFNLAQRYRSPEGVEIADAFAFMSALYFRGKIAYARRFAVPCPRIGGAGIFIITSGYGLVPPDWRIKPERMKKMQKVDIDASTSSYVKPLRQHAKALNQLLDHQDIVILLGSVATGKYVDVLLPILGPRLRFPEVFAGLGDMARGGLMLRAAREGIELEYTTLDAPRRNPGGPTTMAGALAAQAAKNSSSR